MDFKDKAKLGERFQQRSGMILLTRKGNTEAFGIYNVVSKIVQGGASNNPVEQ